MNSGSPRDEGTRTETGSLLPRAHRGALADLAFGSLTRDAASAIEAGRHLAFLPADTLQLDLSDPSQREFGDYELLELIGEGGMGVVYRARQISLDREVAIKLLAAGPWASRDFVERFRREAQNAARMQHPNIVAIYEVGTIDELHFFSMRLIRGLSLAQMSRQGAALAPQQAASLLHTIAEAVEYAHRLNVLHLDLKPANVLIDERGEPHVADFGLARRLDRMIAAEADEISGTPSYMAPEQAQTRIHALTAATDIWGLGAILYELVTGQPPFRGNNTQATLKLVIEGHVQPPRRLAPHLPLDLQAIILKCLGKEPSARYASSRALADDLTRFVEGRPVHARSLNAIQRIGRWTRREPRVAATATLALLALLGGLLTTTHQWQQARSSARLAANNASLANDRLWQSRIDQAATALRNGHSYDALLPLAENIQEREAQGLDAREDRLRFAATERSAPRLIDVVQLPDDISGIALSPDGASVAVATRNEELRLLDLATGAQRWKVNVAGSTHFFPDLFGVPVWLSMLRFSPDGRHVIGRHRQGIGNLPLPMGIDEILIDASSGKLLSPPAARVPGFVHATYSDDGRHALVHTSDKRAQLMNTADWKALGARAAFGNICVLANGGRYLASADEPFTALRLHDPKSLKIMHRFPYVESQAISAWAASPDGDSLAVGHQDGHVHLIDFRTGKQKDIRPSPIGRIGWIAFSPDGHWFGAVADSGDVLVWDSATGEAAAPPRRLDVRPQTFHRDQLLLDASTRTVLASSDMEMALWHLPGRHTPPVRLSGEFPNIAAFWLRVFAYDAQRGLIATDGGMNQLRLWRAPTLAQTGLHASPMPAPQLRIGDGSVVAVDRNRVSVVNLSSGKTGTSLELPLQPSFADLTDDRASLIAVTGPTLSIYDSTSGALRRSPIALPNSPARVLPSPDSRHVFLTFADYAGGSNRELGQTWDLVSGSATSQPLAVDAEAGVRFSADGKTLLRWQGGALQAFDTLALQPRWPAASTREGLPPAKDRAPIAEGESLITDATFSPDGAEVSALSMSYGACILWRFDTGTGKELEHIVLSDHSGCESLLRTSGEHAAIVQRPDEGPLWWDDVAGARDLPSFGYSEYRALTLAPDATMFARATADSIVATSTRSLQWLSPPMPASLPWGWDDARSEHPTQLAFTTDGNSIVGRSRRGIWLAWNVAPDLRPSGQLLKEAEFLSAGPSPASGFSRAALTQAERLALRAQDPGAPHAKPAVSSLSAVPARRQDAPANTVDLGAVFTDSINGEEADVVYSEVAEFAPGLHRFLGVDYDVRGQIQLQPANYRVNMSPSRVEGIRPGISRFVAIDVLIANAGGMRRRERTPLAWVEIQYRDGDRARLPIFYITDADYSGSEEIAQPGVDSARIAWRATMTGSPTIYRTSQKIFAVRLVNPQPDREIASLALEAADVQWSLPTFFAVTLEESESQKTSR